MEPLLTFEEARVLGCLFEKEMVTPDYYPMTVTALVAASNQTTSRDPVVAFDDATVEEALTGLRRKKLAAMLHLAGARAPKYKHLAPDYFPGLHRAEFAVLAVLLLRGAQTTAELRARTERLSSFPDVEATEATLKKLADYQTGPLVRFHPAGAGRRAAMWETTLVPPLQAVSTTVTSPPATAPAADWRTTIEAELTRLRDRVTALETALGLTPEKSSQTGS